MIEVVRHTWPLLFGIGLLMIGNGLQGSLLGVRGEIEGFSTFTMSLVMSAYFAGFLVSSMVTPKLIGRVGHVRVFAALGSFISAVLILYPSVTEPWAWIGLRAVIGFCFCGVYVTAESWLNNMTTTATRGRALSLYMIVQMAGIVSAQGILSLGDPSGFILFIIPSVLVSLSFAPILLSVEPTPAFESTKNMSLRKLFRTSPTGVTGMFLMGGIFAAQFGMSAVYATRAGLNLSELSLFVAVIFVGGVVFQYPIGWLSDRFDRRLLIVACGAGGALTALLGLVFPQSLTAILVAGFFMGGLSNPIYALLIAYVNDYIEYEDMAAASGGLLFVNGFGAVLGPIAVGAALDLAGPSGFWLFVVVLFAALTAYVAYRMTVREAPAAEDTSSYQTVFPTASPVIFDAAPEFYDTPDESAEDAAAETPARGDTLAEDAARDTP